MPPNTRTPESRIPPGKNHPPIPSVLLDLGISIGLYRIYIYIRIKEKNIETTIQSLGLPKLRGTSLWVPKIRKDPSIWGLYWTPPI